MRRKIEVDEVALVVVVAEVKFRERTSVGKVINCVLFKS